MNIVSQDQALEYLKTGGTVVFPTETSYGLGCDATNQKAVDKIFKIKSRRSDKPLLVVVPTVEMARKYLEWNELLEKIAEKYWFTRRSESEGGPGALTIVGNCRLQNTKCRMTDKNNLRSEICNLKLADGVVASDGTVAVRVTDATLPKYLSSKLEKPVVATSANIADAGDIYDAKELIKMYEGREFQPDVIIDAGVLPHNPPSTIISVVGGKLKVLRQGEVRVESL